MATLFDYLRWRGDLTFEEAPQNEVDLLIFSLLSYIDFSDYVPHEFGESPISLQGVANAFFADNPNPKREDLGFLIPKDIFKLFRAVPKTKRFGNVRMLGFVNEIDVEREMQFSAVTFLLNKKEMVIAYRGTDDTLVGWKEDLNMSFLPVVPAQERAAEYLNAVAKVRKSGRISLAGHSKGGNLAIYAGVRSEETIKPRIFGIWNYDGPGFRKEMLTDPGYLEMRSRVHTLIPQSSVVGILLEHDGDATVVQSRQVGVLQHDAFSWNVMGGSFLYLPKEAGSNRQNDVILNQWIRELSPEQRKQFSEALFQIFYSDHALTVTDLASPQNKWLFRSLKLDPKVRKIVMKTISSLMGESAKGVWNEMIKKRKKEKDD